jgi:hypothetical protein
MGEYAITLAPEGITTNTAWFYTYSSSSDVWTAMNNRGWNLEFVPMLWGYNRLAGGVNEYSPSTWASSQGSWPSSTQHALFINEPDVEGQANLSPTDALTLWYNYFAPATTSLKRGHAAVASNYYGIPWLQEFNAACSGDCTYDFHAWHWYGSDFATFQSDLEEFHAAFPDKNIWITEFACNSYTGAGSCSDSQTLAFHAAVQPYLESLDYVERYSPYGALPTGYGDESSSAPINTNNDIMTITSYGGDGFMSLSNLGKFYTGQGSI